MRHIFVVVLITLWSVANAWEIDSVCHKSDAIGGQTLRIVMPITMANIADKNQKQKMLFDIKCNLTSKECVAAGFNLASLDNKKIGIFDLNVLVGLVVYSVESSVIVMKWGLNTFVYNDIEKSFVWMQESASFKGYGKALCKQ
jgi:hypothetical protein